MRVLKTVLHDPEIERICAGVAKGDRNNSAIKLADHLLYTVGMDAATVFETLQNWNQKNRPPLPVEELQSVLNSAIKRPYWSKSLVTEIPGKPMKRLTRNRLLGTLGRTIKHDNAAKLATFLSMISCYGNDPPLNIIFKSDTATGKSHIALECARYFPKSDLIVYTKVSPNAFFHEYGRLDEKRIYHVDLDRKIVVFKDQPHDLLLDQLKPIMSHDPLENKASITDKNAKGQIRTKKVLFDGYPCFVFCTAKLGTSEELANRAFLLSCEETPEKLHESLSQITEKETDPMKYQTDLERDPHRKALRDHILAIRNLTRAHVAIPSLKRVQKQFEKRHKNLTARAQRDYPRLIGLIKALAYLRRTERIDYHGLIEANKEDIADAFWVYDQLAPSNELGLTPMLLGFFEKIIKPLAGLANLTVDRKQIRKKYLENFHKPLSDNKLQRYILPSLEAAGLISIEPDPNDKRRLLVHVEN